MFSKSQCLGSNSTTYKNGQPYFPYTFPVPTYASTTVSTQIFSLPFSLTTTPIQDTTGSKTITASFVPAVSILADSTLPTGNNAFRNGTLTCSSVPEISDGNWSISFWANLASIDATNNFYLLNSSSSIFNIRFKRYDTLTTNQTIRVAYKGTPSNVYATMSTSTITSNTWNFYTITCSPTQIIMFINGTQSKTVNPTTPDTSFYIPSSTFSFSGSSSFACKLSSITIYNSCLTQNQVYKILLPSYAFFLPFTSSITPTKDSSSASLPLVVSGVSIVSDDSLKSKATSLYSFNKGTISCNTIPVSTLGGWSCSFWMNPNPSSTSTNIYVLNSETSDYRIYVTKNVIDSNPLLYFEVKYTDSGYYAYNALMTSSNIWSFFTFSVTSTTMNFSINNTLYTSNAASGKTFRSPSANMLFTANNQCKLSNITIFNSYLAYGQVQNLYNVTRL